MLDFLADVEVPTIVALTKSDKLSKTAAQARAAEISRVLSLETDQVTQFSSHTGEGREELLEAILALLAQPGKLPQ
jgi:GTP-binding protein